MKKFTIEITPVKSPYMRETMLWTDTVAKKRVKGKVVYHAHKWNNPKCGLNRRYLDNDLATAERDRHSARIEGLFQRAFDKAVIRHELKYAGINYQDEIARTYAPYAIAPNATISEMTLKWRKYEADRKVLKNALAKLRTKYTLMMCCLQQGKWDAAKDCLYDLNVYLMELQSLARPDHHEIVFKGKNNPLTANRR